MELEELGLTQGKIKQFQSKNIYTVEELLTYIPKRYNDFRKTVSADELDYSKACAIIGTGTDLKISPKYIKLTVKEKITGKNIYVTWFNQSYMIEKIRKMSMREILICGNFNYSEVYGSISIINPIIFTNQIQENMRIYPIYSKIPGMSSDYLFSSIEKALNQKGAFVENINVKTQKKFNLMSKENTLKNIHFPESREALREAKKRLIFDDLYFFANQMKKTQENDNRNSPCIIAKTEIIEKFIKQLPYELTKDQANTINEILENAKKGTRINALVQGDVGCGKTIISFCLMIAMAENGFQSALMAPTAVLAKQHYNELKKYTKDMGIKIALLTGELKAGEKRKVLKQLEMGEIQIVIGTHSLISGTVTFKYLGLTIVDEEHKFGTVQRNSIREKSKMGVHSVVMSATPIPRTLAMSIYGESMAVYTIRTMPAGRKSVQTAINKSDNRTFEFMKREIDKGHQCYVVCPLIDSSEEMNVESIEEVAAKLRYYMGDEVNISILNGKMKKEEIEESINQFKNNESQILISTTVVEVGINVPNATVMVIRNAEHFGLASLHQLRGRVGRGEYSSYCILNSFDKENERLVAMTQTTDGFEIAEKDLKIRGAGDFIGTKQSGDNKYVMLMLSFPNLYNEIRTWISQD